VGGDRTVHAECEPVRPRITVLRAVMNAIFYIAQTGECGCCRKSFRGTRHQRYFFQPRDDGRKQKINA